jgi:hypothetical protein
MRSGWVISGAEVSVEFLEDVNIRVYPNPVLDSSIKVLFDARQSGALTLCNSLGQILYRATFEGTLEEIIKLRAAGLYFLKIELTSGQKIIRKIIK